LIDDFESYVVDSEIRDAAIWTVTGSNVAQQVVVADPADGTNQVLAAVSNGANIYTPAMIAQGGTGTLFFRLYVPTATHDFAVGMTTQSAPSEAGHHADSFRIENGALNVYHGSFRNVGSISQGNWYNVWHVLDNQADTWQLYVEGSGFAGQQQLAWGSVSDFSFRSGAGTNNLVNFFIRTNANHNGLTGYIDDVYLFASGKDLSLPLYLYWAPGADAGGTGTWDTTNAFWATTADGSGSKKAWPATGPHKDAAFGGTAGTVTVDAAGVTADSIRFTTSGYTIDGGPLTLAGAAPTVTVVPEASATISANITGSDGLRKAGEGKLTLSGTNNHTGGTTVAEGVLTINSTGSLPGWDAAGGFSVADGAILAVGSGITMPQFNTMRSLTANFEAGAAIGLDTSEGSRNFHNDITGALPLVKLGPNQLTLSGNNDYTGLTTVTEGTLMLSSSSTAVPGDLAIRSGAYVRFSQNNQINNNALVVVADSRSAFNGTGINSGVRSSHQETIGSLTVTGGAFNAGDNSIWLITGGASFTGGDGNTAFTGNSGSQTSFGSLSLTAMTATRGPYANGFLIGGNTAARVTTVTVGSGGLTLDGSNIAMRLGTVTNAKGSGLILNGDVTTTGSSPSSIIKDTAAAGTLGQMAVELSSTAGTFIRTFHIGGGGADLLIDADVINGEATAAGILKAGPGTLTLAGKNEYTGGTEIAEGILQIGNGGETGSLVGDVVNDAALVFNRSNDWTYSGNISGMGTVQKLGGGVVMLTGSNTYDGGTGIDGGMVGFGNVDALPAIGQVTVAAGAGLGLRVGGAGFFDAGDVDALFAGTFANVAMADGAFVGIDTTEGNFMYTASQGGDLGLAKLGPNTLTITGAHTYTGGTTVVGGTLALSGAGSLPATGAVHLAGSTAFDISGISAASTSVGSLAGVAGSSVALGSKNLNVGGNNTTTSFAGDISGTGGSLTKSGTGTLTLLGANNTYDGGTTVQQGVLTFGNVNAAPSSGQVTVAAGAGLALRVGGTGYFGASDVDALFAGTFPNVSMAPGALVGIDTTQGSFSYDTPQAGNLGLAKVGSGTLTLAGDGNTYTGMTVVSGGTLMLNKTTGNAVPGDLVITNGYVRFSANEQIADTANVFMSGAGSVLNGTGINSSARSGLVETIASLTVTGGAFNAGATGSEPIWTITGAGTFIGGEGGASFTGQSSSVTSFGSLSLTAMDSEVYLTPNSFWLGGSSTTNVATVTVGAGGLTLDGSNVLMRRGGSSTQFGTRLVLDGDVTTTGSSASAIKLTAASPGTYNSSDIELSSTAGNVTRTFNIGGGGADLFIGVPLTDGAADTASIVKTGPGTLTLGGLTDYTRTSTYTGATTVQEGTLLVDGILQSTSGVALHAGATLGGTGTIAAQVASGGGGAGLVSPGSSAGILAVESIDPTGGMSFAFEFGQVGSPDYTNATNSVNDVLRLTGNPPASIPLTGDNLVSVYFGVTSLELEDLFGGGVYVDAATNAADRALFYQMVKDAEYNYFVLGDGAGTHPFGGASYYSLAEYDSFLKMSLSIVGDAAVFVAGDPAILGSVMQFRVIPEPGAALLLGFGLIGLLAVGRRRRR
jgi:autotransporter-associated beta strand protein